MKGAGVCTTFLKKYVTNIVTGFSLYLAVFKKVSMQDSVELLLEYVKANRKNIT